jgi:hypothetical protein
VLALLPPTRYQEVDIAEVARSIPKPTRTSTAHHARTGENRQIGEQQFEETCLCRFPPIHLKNRQTFALFTSCTQNEDCLDNITRAELSAIDFKHTQTEEKLLRENISGNEEAAQAHYFIGDQVRKAIEAMHAPYPEDLPSAPSIRKMVEERRRKTAKQKKGKPSLSDEQDTLF